MLSFPGRNGGSCSCLLQPGFDAVHRFRPLRVVNAGGPIVQRTAAQVIVVTSHSPLFITE